MQEISDKKKPFFNIDDNKLDIINQTRTVVPTINQKPTLQLSSQQKSFKINSFRTSSKSKHNQDSQNNYETY